MKMAGGREFGDTLDLEAFKAQSKRVRSTDDSAWDTVLKAHQHGLPSSIRSSTVRAGELQRWTASRAITRSILAGEYVKRRADVKRGDRASRTM